MTISQKIRLYQQLAMSTKAGIPLSVALERLKDKIRVEQVGQLATRLTAGMPVGEAFESVGVFSAFECNLIRVGVQTARLEEIFAHLAEYWIRENELGATLIAQAIYPLLIVHVAVFISALPPAVATQSLASGLPVFVFFFIFHLICLYMVLVPLTVTAIYTWHTEFGQRFWMVWPLIGSALQATYIFRWITALRLEYAAGIGLPDAVSDAWKSSGFVGCNSVAKEAELALREGNTLSLIIRKWSRLPRDWGDFIESGEQAGTLETTFQTLGEESAREAASAQDRLRTWLPRIVFVLMMLIVGYFMVSALMAFLAPLAKLFQGG